MRLGTRLLIHELRDETLVYDLASHRASCLNKGAAAVMRAYGPRRSLAEIASECSRTLGADVDESFVALALARLRQAGVIENPEPTAGATRRELLRRVAATAAIALPTVTSVLAPEPAAAQTCLPNGSFCNMSAQCCSGCCMSNTFMCSASASMCFAT